MSDVDRHHLRLAEAILFASAEPVSKRALAERLPDGAEVGALMERLTADYAERGVHLVKVGGGWAFRTAPDVAPALTRERTVARKFSRAAIETMAVIAYHQPLTRAEIEDIRGVGLSKGTLEALLEAGWIRPRGHKEVPGHPMLWGTSDAFLDHFGLEALDALPGMEELKAAGLLHTGPAIDAVREGGAAGDAAAEMPRPLGEDEALALVPASAEEDAMAEPLDPDARA